MDTSLTCFCNKKYSLDAFSSHYKRCENFKSHFKDLDKKLAGSIKRYVDKLDNASDKAEDYKNKLYLLDFFLMKYVNIVHELIAKKDKNSNNFFFNLALQGIDPNLINLPNRTFSCDNFKLEQRQQISSEFEIKTNLSIDQSFFNENKEREEKDLIFDYCKNVYDIDSNFDKDFLENMETSISNMTSRDCFVMVIKNGLIKDLDKKKNDLDKRIITFDGKDKKFYKFEYKDTYFFILLY